MERSRGLRASEITALPWRGGASTQNRIARRRAEPGWRAAVLDEGASRHAFRLRATEEGSGSRAPASASGASNAIEERADTPFVGERRRSRRLRGAIRFERSEPRTEREQQALEN